MPEQQTYETLIHNVKTWADTKSDVRMVLMVGSRARKDTPHDEWSDLDLLIVTTDPTYYIHQEDWITSFGTPWLSIVETTPVGGFSERRVLFEGGMDVDFNIIPTQAFEADFVPEVQSVFHRGVSVVLDKDGLSAHLPAAPKTISEVLAPHEDEILKRVNDFFYQFVWAAKKLRRGELWAAKMCCDGLMKWQVLRMIEWHAKFLQTPPVDTWHNGRFLDRWTDRQTLVELGASFAPYDLESVWQALFATKNLFRRLAQELAETLNYTLPTESLNSVDSLVTSYYQGSRTKHETVESI